MLDGQKLKMQHASSKEVGLTARAVVIISCQRAFDAEIKFNRRKYPYMVQWLNLKQFIERKVLYFLLLLFSFILY